ncbi:hypothetical protein GCM10012320_15620 [Sinomonas cellulolyticus]|nr:hypothetical protein GCM10012320_15620 [Sinomonas sp. KCTC 49339]
MSTEQAFERDPGRPQGPLPWWEALELQNLLDAEDALAAAGHPVDPEPWMLTEWKLDDSPSTLPVRAPRLDDDLLRLVGEEPEQRDPELPGAEDGLLPADEELPSPTAAVADLHAEAADLLVARLERLDREDGARAGERVVALGALARALGAASDDPLLRRDAPSIVASLVSATLKVSARTAKRMVTEALELNTPAWRPLLDAMRRGVLPQRRVRAVLDAALPVPEEKLTRFLAEAIAIAAPTLSDGAPDLDRIPAPGALSRRLRRAADKHASTLCSRALPGPCRASGRHARFPNCAPTSSRTCSQHAPIQIAVEAPPEEPGLTSSPPSPPGPCRASRRSLERSSATVRSTPKRLDSSRPKRRHGPGCGLTPSQGHHWRWGAPATPPQQQCGDSSALAT